ncbi:hypothetical protein DPEC_G00135870 [Dallia pectoralis]|uniref:Uncharacterized protein n=1 Tax=Dallia pectoralis TaxID=75939 RepID=A0ACC2GL39_DALPE|nr:hypothetical protein DPEC_G00135870 [Dallia pectoralis]
MQREDKPSLLLSFHTEIKQESLDPDCDISGAQCSLVDSEMTSVKMEDCGQTQGLNIIKYEEEEEKNGVVNKDEEEERNIGDLTNQATTKKAERKNTEGGPAPARYTPAEELALGLNVSLVEGIPGGSSSLDQQSGTSSSNTLITVNTQTLLAVPKQVLAETCADSEETLSDDCPMEEVPEERATEMDSAQRDTERDIHSLYKRSLQEKILDYDLKKQKIRGEVDLDNLKKKKMALEIELLQKELQNRR